MPPDPPPRQPRRTRAQPRPAHAPLAISSALFLPVHVHQLPEPDLASVAAPRHDRGTLAYYPSVTEGCAGARSDDDGGVELVVCPVETSDEIGGGTDDGKLTRDADVTGKDRARMDDDTRSEKYSSALGHVFVRSAQSRLDRQGCARRAQGMVRARHRRAEHSQNALADAVMHDAIVTGHGLLHDLAVGVEADGDVVNRHLLRLTSEIAQHHPQHRHLPA